MSQGQRSSKNSITQHLPQEKKGFTAPNHTQVPNDLIDYWLTRLSGVELKVLLVIIRQTKGWHRSSATITLSEIKKLTGSINSSIIKATDNLQEKGLIIKFVDGDQGSSQTTYSLVVEDSNNNYTSQNETCSCLKMRRDHVSKEDVTFKDHTYSKETLKERERKVASAPSCSAEAERLSLFLFEKIKETKPDLKQPNLKSWKVELDRMIRIDNRDPEKMEKVMSWLPTAEFWRANILSADKFRKQFDKLELAMQPVATDHRRENIKFFNDLIDSSPGNREALKHLIIRGNFIYNKEKQDGRELDLRMISSAFIPAFLAFAEVDRV